MFRLADAVGYRQLNLTMFEEHRRETLVGAFRRFCDRAADHGLLVGLEFLPYTRIRTLRQAWRIVSEADRENAGVIIDAWHWNRAGTAPEDLDGIPPAKITSVQLCDVLPQPLADMTTEARHHRQLPGAGAGAVAELVSTLRGHGVASPVSVEVFSDDLDALSPDEAARLAGEAGRRCLSPAGWPSAPWTTNQEGAGRP
jgi:sugar phosphate isomerase/epimerase